VGGDEVDGDVFRPDVGEERRDPRCLRRGWAADLQAGRDGFERAGGVVIELKVGGLFGIADPEVDVGLVPDFELPGGDFVEAVSLDQVLSEGGNHRVPERVVAGGRDIGLVPERVQGGGIGGHLLRHKAEFDVGANVVLEQAVVDLVDVGEVVDGSILRCTTSLPCGLGEIDSLAVGIVEADLVVEDGVETDGLEISGLLHGAQIFAIALAERENSAAGAEGLLPEVRKGSCGRPFIDNNELRRLRWCPMQRRQGQHATYKSAPVCVPWSQHEWLTPRTSKVSSKDGVLSEIWGRRGCSEGAPSTEL